MSSARSGSDTIRPTDCRGSREAYGSWKTSPVSRRSQCCALADAEAASRYPHEFSGGQRQRVALARAIAHRPRILIGDEPLSALDVTVRAQILDLLRALSRDGMTLVLVSHDIGVVQNLCEDVAVMKDGRIVEHGPTARVLHHPEHDYTKRLLAAIPVIPGR